MPAKVFMVYIWLGEFCHHIKWGATFKGRDAYFRDSLLASFVGCKRRLLSRVIYFQGGPHLRYTRMQDFFQSGLFYEVCHPHYNTDENKNINIAFALLFFIYTVLALLGSESSSIGLNGFYQCG